MAFFRREFSPLERFESALKSKKAERQKLVDRLNLAESELAKTRAAAEQLAMADAGNAALERAEARLRSVEDRVKTLRAAVAEFDEEIAATDRALADALAQRERDLLADRIEAVATSIERAVPGFASGATALIDAAAKGAAIAAEATRFSADVEEVRREVLGAAGIVCWELRTLAARARVGNANVASPLPESVQPQLPGIDRQMIYTLNPLKWQEGSEVRKVPAFAPVELPKTLLPIALQRQHVDHLHARRVQTLMHVHGSGGPQGEPSLDDAQYIDLDVLAKEDFAKEAEATPQTNVA